MKRLLLLVLVLCAQGAAAQAALPVVRSNRSVLSIRDGDQLRADSWTLAPAAKPDVYEAQLTDGRAHRVTFITDVDSISFLVEEGKRYDFIVQKGDTLNYTQIVGTRFVPAAEFGPAYQRAYRGTTRVQIPEVYELVNIAIALTPTAIENRNLVVKRSPYYAAMRSWFDPYASHPVVAMLDSALKRNENVYFTLKMNGNAFEFARDGRIVRSRVFDRTGFTGERSNSLLPYIAQLQDFAARSRFREFYRRQHATYASQIAFYRDTADVAAMRSWLERNFPDQKPYDAYNIIFSPLVGGNQSTTWFASNGFSELQPHVNFPYPDRVFSRRATADSASEEARRLYRGNIVFTEINHGYINPEAERYAGRIARAISNRDLWVNPAAGRGYYGGNSLFNEYMNWVLVSLRFADVAPEADRDRMIGDVEVFMVNRNFTRFPEFSRFLVPLYRNRPAGRTLADLYPEIIAWFERENAAHTPAPGR